ncbi:MAG: HemK2/MTQ2 family protein methyltransferase [Candidatus Thorarchaeota archaeon]
MVVYDDVYPPSDDTFLLVDAIALGPEDTFLEVGCGTGYVTIVAAMTACRVVATDISHSAVRNTIVNAERNSAISKVAVIQTDLMQALHPDTKFSVIAFNPPYLPADDEQSDLDDALVGGETGTEITLRFIDQAVQHLRAEGRLYIVTSSRGDISSIERALRDRGFTVESVASCRFLYEEIRVLQGVAG